MIANSIAAKMMTGLVSQRRNFIAWLPIAFEVEQDRWLSAT
jgi:hypothetical protein